MSSFSMYHYGKQMHEDTGALRLAIRVMTKKELYAKELSERAGMEISFVRTPVESLSPDEWVWIRGERGIKNFAMKIARGTQAGYYAF